MGILSAIALLGEINDGKSDRETHKLVKKIIKAMEEKKRQEWPDKRLREMVNKMDNIQRNYLLETLKDMDQALTEHYGPLEV
jgi:isopropylmalate/homocitrate/citramalate synthase